MPVERERELAFSAIVLRCDILCFLLSTCERRIGWKRGVWMAENGERRAVQCSVKRREEGV
jgi:hypothetical protein